MTQTFSKLSIDDRGVATVLLSRPEKHNAFNDQLIIELTQHFESLAKNECVRIVIVRAQGKSFSAGADLSWMKRMAALSYDDNIADAQALAHMLHTLNTLPQPTIAQVQGSAFGGGIGLIACCDLVIAQANAKFCFSEVKLGLTPATISPYVITKIGAGAARRFFISAELFDAQAALTMGLLTEVVQEQQLDQRVMHWLEVLAANSPEAMVAAKRLVHDYAGQPITAAIIADSSQRIAAARTSSQGQEGMSAFFEQRRANWQVGE